MTDYKKEARLIEKEIINNRRIIHQFAETGFDLPQTKQFVKDKLSEMGIVPQDCGISGITAVIGEGEKCILLRADMDALPMKEQSGLDFAAVNGNCHSCGHDTHAAMLLGAAKLLKQNEAELKGKVKLMFQPAEEILGGAADMISAGVLEDPHVDAAFAMHAGTGNSPATNTGNAACMKGYQTFSADCIKVTVKGFQAHGARPYLGVDAINIAAHIVIALHELSAHETVNTERSVVLVGKIYGGSGANTLSGECTLEISVRAETSKTRDFLKQRVKEISEGIALAFRGKADVEYVYGTPPLYNDPAMTESVSGYIEEIIGADHIMEMNEKPGSEDFAFVAEKVPSVYVFLGAGSLAGEGISVHHPSVLFDEKMFVTGAALYAHVAARWLEEHASGKER